MNETLYLRQYHRNVGIICLILFVGMMVLSAFYMPFDVPQNVRIYAVCLFVAIFGFWAALSVWGLLAYWRESLSIKDGRAGLPVSGPDLDLAQRIPAVVCPPLDSQTHDGG